MKTIISKLIAFYKKDYVQKIWKDPVWSKVISALILGIFAGFATAVRAIFDYVDFLPIIKYPYDLIVEYIGIFRQTLDKWIVNEYLNFFAKTIIVLIVFVFILRVIFYLTKDYWIKLIKKQSYEKDIEIPVLRDHPANLFDWSIASAFPGLPKDVSNRNQVHWIENSKQAAHRLYVLFNNPLKYSIFDQEKGKISGEVNIYWWFRGYSSMYIEKFKILNKSLCLLDDFKELNISKVAVYKSHRMRLSYIYVETKEIKPTGLYDSKYIEASINRAGYYEEPYAIFRNKFISPNDYDDGATIIKGKVVPTDGAKSRVRQVSKYNFIIASQYSPYNTRYFERESNHYLNGVLLGTCSYGDLFEFMRVCREEHDENESRIDGFEHMTW